MLAITLEKARVKAQDHLYCGPDIAESARLASRIMLKEHFEEYAAALDHDTRLARFAAGSQKHLDKEGTDVIIQIAEKFLTQH